MPPVRRSQNRSINGDSDSENPQSTTDKLIVKVPFSSSLRTRTSTLKTRTIDHVTVSRKTEYRRRLRAADCRKYDALKKKDADRKRNAYNPIASLTKQKKEPQRSTWRLAKQGTKKKSSKVIGDAPGVDVHDVPCIRIKDMTAD